MNLVPLTETQIVTKRHVIAKRCVRYALENLIDDKDYSNKQIREVAQNMGTSTDVIKRNYTAKKVTGFDVNVFDDEPKRIRNKSYTIIHVDDGFGNNSLMARFSSLIT